MANTEQQKKEIINFAKSVGFDLVRVAPIKISNKYNNIFKRWISEGQHGSMTYLSNRVKEQKRVIDLLPGTKSVIMFGVNYYYEDQRKRKLDEGWISRYAFTRDYHKTIKKKLKDVSRFISERYGAETKFYIDTGPILEKAYAETSGMGYMGKNTCLITEQFGSWVFLAELLTTLELPEDENTLKINCGTCNRCVTYCPTDAINSTGTIDARKCISYLTIENKDGIPLELRKKVGGWIFGCDICQEICPHNGRQIPADLESYTEIRIKDRVLALSEILAIENDEKFLTMFAGTPLMRAKRRGLIRNACVVAGNSGQKKLIPFLQNIVHREEDMMLKEHANWAIKEILRANGKPIMFEPSCKHSVKSVVKHGLSP